MDVQSAAILSLKVIDGKNTKEEPYLVSLKHTSKAPASLTIEHARWLLVGVRDGYATGTQAHRWLGWAQCIMCNFNAATLDELRQINKES